MPNRPEKGLPPAAPTIFHIGPFPVTNSMLVTWIVAIGIIVFAQYATRKMKDVPDGAQNFWEFLVESLVRFSGRNRRGRPDQEDFWFFATIFIFIFFTNWFGCCRGWAPSAGDTRRRTVLRSPPVVARGQRGFEHDLRHGHDFMVLWFIWALQSNGINGFVLHIFGPKGDSQGALKYFMILVFFLVGFIEVMSIAFRPISLSFRLYGNVFAGENLLDAMSHHSASAWAKAVFSALLPIPFYLLELLVGFVQAIVFMLLTAVFTGVICMHDEDACARQRRITRIYNFGGWTVFNCGSRRTQQKQVKKGHYGNANVGRNGRQHPNRFGRLGFGHRRGIGGHEGIRSGGTQSRRVRQSDRHRHSWHGALRGHRVLRDLPGRELILNWRGARVLRASLSLDL
jgi:F-type H+-transporting ATPase subunit a